jgi:hypothetical protein
MVKLIPECVKCRSPVTDSVEPEVEEHGQLKRGRYTNSVWICNDCLKREKNDEEKKVEEKLSSIVKEKSGNNIHSDNIGVASPSDVSPNTPRADEAGL